MARNALSVAGEVHQGLFGGRRAGLSPQLRFEDLDGPAHQVLSFGSQFDDGGAPVVRVGATPAVPGRLDAVDNLAGAARCDRLLDGDDVLLNTEKDGVKGRNLARDGRFALCVDEDRPPYAFVLLQGRAEISEDPDETLRWAGRLGARYMGEGRAEEYAARNGGPGNLLVRARIEKVIAFAGIAD